MTKNKNFSNQATPSVIDTEYQDCNFAHTNCIDDAGQKKGVRIFPGDDTPRTFIDCNVTNCEPPPNSIIKKANGNLTGPSIIERMVVVATDTVTVDGNSITVDEYADRIHGSLFEGVYSYHATPIDIPREVK